MKKKIPLLAAFLAALFLTPGCSQEAIRPKRVILLIGDGMGVAQVTAGRTVKGSLNLERMPVGGFLTTHSANHYVTDSAAGGTALACGEKTNNGMVGVRPDSSAMTSTLDVAESTGWATGLVAACKITHATPASFDANVPDRDDYNAIARQMAGTQAEVLFGGGLENFLPQGTEGSKRQDDLDLVSELRATHTVVTTPEEFMELGTPQRAVALLEMGHILPAHQRAVSLAEMTKKALDILDQDPDGFFLMVEGSQIDWEGHDNDSDGIIREMIDFDEAVGVVLDWAKQHGETLVVVTADHETGGYALLDGSIENHAVTQTHFATGDHTGAMVPLFATGPQASRFGGIHDNTDVSRLMKAIIQGQ